MSETTTPEPEPKRCEARHPTNHTVVPCVLVLGHDGDHFSTTGCAGSGIYWAPEPGWLPPLRERTEVEVAERAASFGITWSTARRLAETATSVAALAIHPLYRRIAELEADARAIGGDPDCVVDPRDHEAAVLAMREEMHGGGRMGSRIGVNEACDIAEKHMLRAAQSALSTPAPGGSRLSGGEGKWARARVVLAQAVEDMEADSERWDGEPMSEANVAAQFGEVRAVIAALAGVVSALTQLSSADMGAPAPEVREVPAGEAIEAYDVREGDLLHLAIPIADTDGPDVLIDLPASWTKWSKRCWRIPISSDEYDFLPGFTVSRPVSPLPDQPGAVIRCETEHWGTLIAESEMLADGVLDWRFVGDANLHTARHITRVIEVLSAGAGVDEGGKP